MGYTHYWTKDEEMDTFSEVVYDEERFKKFVSDMKEIVDTSNVELGRFYFGKDAVLIDGEPGETCETFAPSQESENFRFCKTRRLPYDEIVTAGLIALKDRFPEINVSSDGGLRGLRRGVGLFEEALGREIPDRFKKDQTKEE